MVDLDADTFLAQRVAKLEARVHGHCMKSGYVQMDGDECRGRRIAPNRLHGLAPPNQVTPSVTTVRGTYCRWRSRPQHQKRTCIGVPPSRLDLRRTFR